MRPPGPPLSGRHGAGMDPASRALVVRFLFKPPVAVLLASLLGGPILAQVAALLLLYAIVTMLGAFLLRQRLFERGFTLWDETSWLVGLALGLRMVA
ncbi:hypothetical protein ACI7BZ_08470 [Xanthobacter sp. AM11]|uniref:hypothetical protein n=1 Tax=Xanthobacter sp. AM11 TaxID=3380643 RepID=UPI0039BFEDD1